MINRLSTFPKELVFSLKGVMQMLIVMSHLHYAVSGTILPFVIANKLGTSVIALYLFISGFGLTTSIVNKEEHTQAVWSGFFTRRLWGLLKPFLIVSSLYLFVNPSSDSAVQLFYNLVHYGQTPLPNAWFIFVLCFLYLAFYLSFRWRLKSNYGGGVSTIILLSLSLLILVVPIILDYERAWWVTTLSFVAGVVYAYWERVIYSWLSSYRIVFLLLLLGGVLASKIDYLLPLAFVCIPLIIIRIVNLGKCKDWIIRSIQTPISKQVLSFLSNISYELYLVHGAVIACFDNYRLFKSNHYIFSLAVIATSFALATFLHFSLKAFSLKPHN